MIFMGKSMVSGFDFPLKQSIEYDKQNHRKPTRGWLAAKAWREKIHQLGVTFGGLSPHDMIYVFYMLSK